MTFTRVQLIALIGSITFILTILWYVRQKRIKEAYAMLWLLAGVCMVVMALWSNLLDTVSKAIGIVYPPATLFLILQGGCILILFQYTILLSRTQGRVSRLSQEIALLRRELEELKKDKKQD